MSVLVYNGIVLDRGQIRVQRVAVESGEQRLFTKWSIHVRGYFSPSVISYANLPNLQNQAISAGLGGLAAVAVAQALFAGAAAGGFAAQAAQNLSVASTIPPPGVYRTPALAPLTDVAVRDLLMRPRKRLILASGPNIYLDVPKPPLTCDADNGPKPVSCDVIEIEGIKTFKIDFVVTCTTNEVGQTNVGPLPDTNPPTIGSRSTYRVSPLLCHEWTMDHDVDADFFTTRTVTGRAIMRSDIMTQNNLIPDQLRYWLGHPVPQGMSRQNIKVKALPDGKTVEYSFVDRERVYNYDPNILTRVEIVYNREVVFMGLEDRLRQLSGMGGIWALGLVAGVGVVGGLGGMINDLWGGGGNVNIGNRLQNTAMNLLAGNVPFTNHTITVRCWGHPRSRMSRIDAEARNIAIGRFNLGFNGQPGGFQNNQLNIAGREIWLGSRMYRQTYDLAGKFVEYIITAKGSVLLGLLGDALPPIQAPDNAPVVPVATYILDNPMRGPYLGACVARALRDVTTPWDQPADPPRVNDANNETRSLTSSNFTLQGITAP